MLFAGGSNESSDDSIAIRVYWWGNQVRNDVTQQVANLYMEENPGISIETEFTDWSGYWDRLSATAAGGTMPDIVQMDYAYLEPYVANGLLTNLEPYIKDGTIDISRIPDSVLASGRISGDIYALSLGNSAPMMTYNREVVESAGVEIPDYPTIEDLYELGEEIFEKTGVRTYYDGGFNMLQMVARNNGTTIFTELANGDMTSTLEHFRNVKRFQDAPFAISPDILVEKNADIVEMKPIVDGTSWNDFSYANQYIAICNAVGKDLGMAMYPKTTGAVAEAMYLQPSQFFTIAATSNHKEEAAEFINWFINSDEANVILMAERGTPANIDVATSLSEVVDERSKVVFDFMNKVSDIASPLDPPDPQGRGEIEALVKTATENVRFGTITPEEAAQDIVRRAERILNE